MIIYFVGKKGSGKSTCSQWLIENQGFQKLSFAKSLKECVAHLYDIDEKLLDSLEYKEAKLDKPWVWDAYAFQKLCGFYGMAALCRAEVKSFSTPREAMQYIGTDILREIDPEFHINRTKDKIIKANTDGEDICLDDCRFCNETDMLNKYGGIGIYIDRPGLPHNDHISENELTIDMFNHVIDNSGTKEELLARFKEVFSNIYK